MSTDQNQIQPLVVDRQGLAKLGIDYSKRQLLDLEAADRFPKRIRLSERRVVWRIADIEAWLDERELDSQQTKPAVRKRKRIKTKTKTKEYAND